LRHRKRLDELAGLRAQLVLAWGDRERPEGVGQPLGGLLAGCKSQRQLARMDLPVVAMALELLAQPLLAAPGQRAGNTARERIVGGRQAQQAADHPQRRPGRESDRAAGPHHAKHLVDRSAAVGAEHGAERRHDDIEVGLGIRQRREVVDVDVVEIEQVAPRGARELGRSFTTAAASLASMPPGNRI